MFSATCSSCGKEATVPFQPRGDKPVYCSDCFRTQSAGSASYSSDRRGGGYGESPQASYGERGSRGGSRGGSRDRGNGW